MLEHAHGYSRKPYFKLTKDLEESVIMMWLGWRGAVGLRALLFADDQVLCHSNDVVDDETTLELTEQILKTKAGKRTKLLVTMELCE